MPSLRILGGAALSLLGLCLLGLSRDPLPAPALSQPDLADPRPAAAPAGGPRVSAAALAATLLARPLFAAGRRPVAPPLPGATPRASIPRLTGIVVIPGLRRAIFASREAGRSLAAAEGETLGGFRIVSIGRASVDIDGETGPRTLQLETDQSYRSAFVGPPPTIPLVDPVRREAETENDQ